MNRIKQILQKEKKLLSIYITAGYPSLNDTVGIIKSLENSGVDMVEIGLPFSDPISDGVTIQNSSSIAIKSGMTVSVLFEQLNGIRNNVNVPLVIMGYFNSIYQYGIDKFCYMCSKVGVDGCIIPDLPLDIYINEYKKLFDDCNISFIPLITPQTSIRRIRFIDKNSSTFIYMVSSSSITGVKECFEKEQLEYFETIKNLNLQTPQLVGFGVSNQSTFNQATKYQKGAIIGSSFIEHITKNGISSIANFVEKIRS